MADVIWTPDALDDLYRIEVDASRFSISYAAATTDRIRAAVGILSEFPEMGRRLPSFRSRNIRQLIIRNHMVTYPLIGDQVRIMAVMGGSQTLRESDFQ